MPFVEKQSRSHGPEKLRAGIEKALQEKNSKFFEVLNYTQQDCDEVFAQIAGLDRCADINFEVLKTDLFLQKFKNLPHSLNAALMALLISRNFTELRRAGELAVILFHHGADVDIFRLLETERLKINCILHEAFYHDLPDVVAKVRPFARFDEDIFNFFLGQKNRNMPFIFATFYYGSVDLLKEALKTGVKIDALQEGWTIIHYLARKGAGGQTVNNVKEKLKLLVFPESVVPELKGKGQELNKPDLGVPLEHAIWRSQETIARALLETSIELKKPLMEERTKSLWGLFKSCPNEAFALLLLELFMRYFKVFPLEDQYDMLRIPTQEPIDFLLHAIDSNWVQTTNFILEQYPELLNHPKYPPILYAVGVYASHAILWNLIRRGADLSAKGIKDKTALESLDIRGVSHNGLLQELFQTAANLARLHHWHQEQEAEAKVLPPPTKKKRDEEKTVPTLVANAPDWVNEGERIKFYFQKHGPSHSFFKEVSFQVDQIHRNTMLRCFYIGMAMVHNINLINTKKLDKTSRDQNGSAWLIVHIFSFLDLSILKQTSEQRKAQNEAQTQSDLKKENKQIIDFVDRVELKPEDRNKFIKYEVTRLAQQCLPLCYARLQPPPVIVPTKPQKRQIVKAKRKGARMNSS